MEYFIIEIAESTETADPTTPVPTTPETVNSPKTQGNTIALDNK